ncbi:MAG: methylated-DNA--[protein]-cysteine S-methyltransferase [Planctomycetes bacterium]|nr:methylated-DNA--[protein]-cysteine S-methyltransferase [Planctomycetota bacterium]
MLRAFQGRDASFEGVFLTAVLTTGIFCRPTCPARKPKPENVEFFAEVGDALRAGYRPCRRCRPLEVAGAPPDWLRPLLAEVEADPQRRWRDRDLRDLGLEPTRVRRWFRAQHGMTFHAYARARRLGLAFAAIRAGDRVTEAAFSHGYDSLSGFGEAIKRLLGEPPRKGAAKREPVVLRRITSPLGTLLAGATESGICLLEFSDRRRLEAQLRCLQRRLGAVFAPGTTPLLETLEAELVDYFAGTLEQFQVPLHAPGTPFQEQVWAGLREIPPGQTRSYSELAESLGRPSAVRAVARANGDNRLAILIPCHRVVGRDGRLTGYGGGLWRKRRLLQIEGVWVADGA